MILNLFYNPKLNFSRESKIGFSRTGYHDLSVEGFRYIDSIFRTKLLESTDSSVEEVMYGTIQNLVNKYVFIDTIKLSTDQYQVLDYSDWEGLRYIHVDSQNENSIDSEPVGGHLKLEISSGCYIRISIRYSQNVRYLVIDNLQLPTVVNKHNAYALSTPQVRSALYTIQTRMRENGILVDILNMNILRVDLATTVTVDNNINDMLKAIEELPKFGNEMSMKARNGSVFISSKSSSKVTVSIHNKYTALSRKRNKLYDIADFQNNMLRLEVMFKSHQSVETHLGTTNLKQFLKSYSGIHEKFWVILDTYMNRESIPSTENFPGGAYIKELFRYFQNEFGESQYKKELNKYLANLGLLLLSGKDPQFLENVLSEILSSKSSDRKTKTNIRKGVKEVYKVNEQIITKLSNSQSPMQELRGIISRESSKFYFPSTVFPDIDRLEDLEIA